jgi:hypothetical protein
MSGASIPYHLRQNKAIDRYAFIELLSIIDRYCSIDKYTYIGFGGHSLEDFKYIHSRFAITNMTSIEQDEEVHKRQKFNQPYNCINYLLKSSDDFIDEFQADQETIIWLDYTSPSKIRSQLEEVQSIVSKLAPLDIVKITLNAHASAYHEAPKGQGITNEIIQQGRFDKIKNILGELFPIADITLDMMTEKRFTEALCLILKSAIESSLHGSSHIFQPLTLFSYADGHKMLTVTGIVLENDKIEDFLEKTNIRAWNLSNINWEKPQSINVPDLTIRERLYIDALLPHTEIEEIQNKLGFLFHDEKDISIEMLKTYVLFYRQSPYFSRIMM